MKNGHSPQVTQSHRSRIKVFFGSTAVATVTRDGLLALGTATPTHTMAEKTNETRTSELASQLAARVYITSLMRSLHAHSSRLNSATPALATATDTDTRTIMSGTTEPSHPTAPPITACPSTFALRSASW